MSLKRRFKKITDKPKNKKWFDANLHKERGNLLNYGKIDQIQCGDMSYVLIGTSISPEIQ
jgi:hypothetical protein